MDRGELEALSTNIDLLKSIMVTVSTGGARIEDKESEYLKLYKEIAASLALLTPFGFNAKNPNPFRSLWDWHGYWSTNIRKYAERRLYVAMLYEDVLQKMDILLSKQRVSPLPRTGFMHIDHPADQLSTPQKVLEFALSMNLLHPTIINRCRVLFETGEYDNAIFNALKAVEDEIRQKSGANMTDLGVNLVTRVMNPSNPVIRMSDVTAEVEAAHALYRGAIGLFKNPLSHRFLDTNNPVKTFEILSFASLLLRMLDEVE